MSQHASIASCWTWFRMRMHGGTRRIRVKWFWKISKSTCASHSWKKPGCQNQAKWFVLFVRLKVLGHVCGPALAKGLPTGRRMLASEKNARRSLVSSSSQMVSIDFFTVPTVRFQVLYVFLVLAHDRRRVSTST